MVWFDPAIQDFSRGGTERVPVLSPRLRVSACKSWFVSNVPTVEAYIWMAGSNAGHDELGYFPIFTVKLSVLAGGVFFSHGR